MTNPGAAPAEDAAQKPTSSQPESSAELVISEEQLSVDRQWVRSGVVRLHRRVITETRTVEVTLRRTELVIESEDVDFSTDGVGVGTARTTDALPEPPETPGPLVIVLAEEVPQVTTVVRPYERVTVTVARITDTEEHTAELAAERVELDAPTAVTRGQTAH